MGLFDKLLKKENKETEVQENLPAVADTAVVSPCTGKLIPAAEISDPVFAEEMLGQTIAVIPTDGTVVCPVNGTVTTMFPTGHAFGVTANDGNAYLVHIGIDTVSMNGKGFNVLLKEGQKVVAGQNAVIVDLNEIAKAGLDATTMLIVAEKVSDDFKVDYITSGDVVMGQVINQ